MNYDNPLISEEMRSLIKQYMQATVDRDDEKIAELHALIQEKRKTEGQ